MAFLMLLLVLVVMMMAYHDMVQCKGSVSDKYHGLLRHNMMQLGKVWYTLHGIGGDEDLV